MILIGVMTGDARYLCGSNYLKCAPQCSSDKTVLLHVGLNNHFINKVVRGSFLIRTSFNVDHV